MLLPEINDIGHSNHPELVHGVSHIHVVRIRALPIHGGFYLNIEISAVEIVGGNTIAIFCEMARRERCTGAQLESRGCGKLFIWNVVIAGDLHVINQRLSTFFNAEHHVDLRLVVNRFGSDLHLLISAIVVQGLQVLDTLVQELLAQVAVSEETRPLDHHKAEQILVRNLMVSAKNDVVDLVLLSLLDFINQQNLVGLALEVGVDLDVEVTLFLKVIDQVLLPFPDQITINLSLGIDRDQSLHASA